jgi:hypothetical protein
MWNDKLKKEKEKVEWLEKKKERVWTIPCLANQ